jgi:predicted TIM-barrel fold metal-dependent hydrolase
MSQAIADSTLERVRAQINHPIVDSDSHYLECFPLLAEQLIETVGELAGAKLRDELAAAPDLRRYLLDHTTPAGLPFGSRRWANQSLEERRENWLPIPAWTPPNSSPLDKATALVPSLRYERMEEIGIDFSILFPTSHLVLPHLEPSELRQVVCRAMNVINARTYGPYSDRMTPVALIPMWTPNEAIAELEYSVNELGLKVAMIGHVARPIPGVQRDHPDLLHTAFRVDAFGIDSDYDYDPFWAKCAELKVPLTAHNPTYGMGFRRSPTNYIYNQTTTFAEAGDLLCRALFLGGVTRRFPTLKFQFSECGAGWLCVLYAELVHRWEKRNFAQIRSYIETAKAAEPEFRRLVGQHGDPRLRATLEQWPDAMVSPQVRREPPDDFAACEISTPEDILDLFAPRFFVGCEADDPITPWAFNTAINPLGARLRAMLGSDLGHWDVPDVRGIVPETFEAVERGLMSEDDFRRFTLTHACELFAGVNPDFFKGSSVEPFVTDELARS